MPEKTKQKEDTRMRDDAAEKSSAENKAIKPEGNWSEDQKEKSYYYDDSYGYEIYNPEDDDEEN